MRKEFACSFAYGGNTYAFTIWAESWEQAEDMLSVLAVTGRVDGEIQWIEGEDDDIEEPPAWVLWGMPFGNA